MTTLAQAPTAPHRVAGSVETSILELDAVVTDKDGRPVSGLKASDFDVKIGGKRVAIENFYERRTLPAGAAESGAPEPGQPAAPAAAAAAGVRRPPRHLVLFLDRLYLWEKWKSDATFDALRDVLHRMVAEPGDDAMIVTWDRAIGAVIPFTSDLVPLERLLEKERMRSRQPLPEETTIRQLVDEATWFATNPVSSGAGGVEVSQRAAQAEAYAAMRAKSAALKAVCAAIGGLPGRKVLVHASHRFSRIAGLEFSAGGLDAQEFNAMAMVDSVAEAANANGVTMYTFFPEGWNEDGTSVRADIRHSALAAGVGTNVLGLSDAVVHNEAAALEVVADRTGGTFSLGWREGPALAARVVADVESSYSLGVAATGGKPGTSQAVKVTVRNPALTVRARRAALERTPEERVEARVLSNLFRPEPPSRLRVSLDSASVEAAKKKTTATLRVRVPIGGLAKTPSARGESGAFSVFVVSAAADGAFTEVVRQRRPFEIARADAEKAAAGHFTYEVPVVVGSGEARISVGVWDEVGKDAGFLLVEVRDGQAAVRR
ncbi:MAG: VWA domain-containing protein [Acidobacteria bacterium]|nr:VWA domain-containing protein [Acidobacteriota bacterium]